jgi:1,4-alpha-glucan branching enzyme
MYTILSAPASNALSGVSLFFDGSGASFRVWAPNALSVSVSLKAVEGVPFVTLPLAPDTLNPAYWSASISNVAAGHYYQFELVNRRGDTYDPGGLPFLRTDPYARLVTSSDPTLPALVVDPSSFVFTAPFQTPAFENFIIYQAHVGSFAGRNDGLAVFVDPNGGTADFAQFEEKLDYIRSMHFNAIQFLPTGEYRGVEGEAYNPSNYYAPEVLYGPPDTLRRLIDACHQRGLAVFLDVVYNHMDTTHNLWQFDGNTNHRTDESDPRTGGGIYFSAIETPFGRRPDHDSSDVQRFFRENAAMWFREYQVDGLRFDSAANFSEGGLKAIVQPLLTEFPDKFLYAEDDDPSYIFNDIGFRACWDMGSADAFAHIISDGDISGLQNLIGRFGYPTAYSAIKYLLGSHDQVFNQWSYDNARQGGYWAKPGGEGLRENRYFVERIGGAVTGRDNWYARAQARLGWALNVAMPCTPLLFMGSECHHYGYWNPANDPYGDHRFDWSIAGDPIGWAMRTLVADINAVRWNHPALRSDLPPLFPHIDIQNRVLAFLRLHANGEKILVVVNLGDQQWNDPVYGVHLAGTDNAWSEIFNSQAPQYGGWSNSGNGPDTLYVGSDGLLSIRLPQWSVLLFRNNP